MSLSAAEALAPLRERWPGVGDGSIRPLFVHESPECGTTGELGTLLVALGLPVGRPHLAPALLDALTANLVRAGLPDGTEREQAGTSDFELAVQAHCQFIASLFQTRPPSDERCGPVLDHSTSWSNAASFFIQRDDGIRCALSFAWLVFDVACFRCCLRLGSRCARPGVKSIMSFW